MFLNCKTYFSFRYGTYSAEDLVSHAAALGHNTLALTNINNTCDLWDFVDFCQQHAIKPIAGTEIRQEKTIKVKDGIKRKVSEFLYILLAKNNDGVSEINHFLSIYLDNKLPFPERPDPGSNVFIIYPLGVLAADDLDKNELIGVLPTEATKLFNKGTEIYPEKYIVRHPVTFKKGDYVLHRLLRAIDKNILLSKLESNDTCENYERFVPVDRLEKAFGMYPDIIANTSRITEACSVNFEFNTDKNKKTFLATSEEDRLELKRLAIEGLKSRYKLNNKEAVARVKKELKVIDDLGFNAYFLITHDVIQFAQSRGFFHAGRGSGANSIVAYCLRITDVDPIRLDLYFERFLNKYRTSPPDFDLDFSWKDRDEVIAYIFKKYGREYVALLGMYATFKHNAAVRELGKVYGLPTSEVNALLNDRDATFRENGIQKLILEYGQRLISFPNHLSIHPGGMLISDLPIRKYLATYLPPKGFLTAQLDMFVAEKIGLYKLDVLSQRGLGHIKEAVELIKQNHDIDFDIHDIQHFLTDERIADQIRRADTIGCFYIESPAMRQLLLKLRCDSYLTLVAASSIIRPGVSQSGMMKAYIQRFHKPDSFKYLHPVLEEHLKETYGVMVYQEDVIKIAHHYAGLDMAEADVLRRAMSGKFRGGKEMERLKLKFFAGAKALKRPLPTSMEVWRQIQSFAGYSFSKAHSASYASESYQSLALKTYFPIEFMVAVINNEGGFYSTELYFHELKKAGAIVHLPCVNRSDEFTNVRGKDVFIGLRRVQGLRKKLKEQILDERLKNGDYKDLTDFIERTAIGEEQLNKLIDAGALRFTGKSKKELLWQANFIQQKSKNMDGLVSLFKTQPVEYAMPQFNHHYLDDAKDEIELLGFPMGNPFNLVTKHKSDHPAANLVHYVGQQVTLLGYIITMKPVHTSKGEGMFFGTFIDAAGNWLDTVHFPRSAEKYPLYGRGFYRISGVVMNEFGAYSVNVAHMVKVAVKAKGDPDYDNELTAVTDWYTEKYSADEMIDLRSQMDYIKEENDDSEEVVQTSFAA
jgi:DNA polymerase-3 subunit alpha